MKIVNKLSYTSFVLHFIFLMGVVLSVFSFSSSEYIANLSIFLLPVYTVVLLLTQRVNRDYINLFFLLSLFLSCLLSIYFPFFLYKDLSLLVCTNIFYLQLLTYIFIFTVSCFLFKKLFNRNYLVSFLLFLIYGFYFGVTYISIQNIIEEKIEFYQDIASFDSNPIKIPVNIADFDSTISLNDSLDKSISITSGANDSSSKVISKYLTLSKHEIDSGSDLSVNPLSLKFLNVDILNEVLPIVVINYRNSIFIIDTTSAKSIYLENNQSRYKFISYINLYWILLLFLLNIFHYIRGKKTI